MGPSRGCTAENAQPQIQYLPARGKLEPVRRSVGRGSAAGLRLAPILRGCPELLLQQPQRSLGVAALGIGVLDLVDAEQLVGQLALVQLVSTCLHAVREERRPGAQRGQALAVVGAAPGGWRL